MALLYGGTLAGNQLTAINTTVGSGALLRIYSGSAAAHPESTEPGGLLCTITLPAVPLTITNGTISAAAYTTLSGAWTNTASGGGAGTTALSWRIYNSAGTTCHMQGAIPGELSLNNASIATGQTVTINTFTITAGNFT